MNKLTLVFWVEDSETKQSIFVNDQLKIKLDFSNIDLSEIETSIRKTLGDSVTEEVVEKFIALQTSSAVDEIFRVPLIVMKKVARCAVIEYLGLPAIKLPDGVPPFAKPAE